MASMPGTRERKEEVSRTQLCARSNAQMERRLKTQKRLMAFGTKSQETVKSIVSSREKGDCKVLKEVSHSRKYR